MRCFAYIVRHTALLALVLMAASLTSASAQTRIHEVKKGDTMVSIAQAYQMTTTELRVLNKLPDERLEVGQKLRVRDIDPIWPSTAGQATAGVGIDPRKIDEQSRRDTTSQLTRRVENPAHVDTLYKTALPAADATLEGTSVEREHLVQPGETLFSIANTYGMLLADLKRRNGIVSNDITAGQVLVVRTQDSVKASEQEPSKERVQVQPEVDVQQNNLEPEKHEWYEVKTTDTLPSIARQFGMSIAQLRDLNGSMVYTMNAGDRIIVNRRLSVDDETRSEPPPAEVIESSILQQPPSSELKPPVEHADPPPIEAVIPVARVDSTIRDSAVVAFDPFENVVNRGRFIGYVVKRNERLAAILDLFQMDESDFYALNPSLDGRPPRAGAEILVYEPPSNLQPNPYAVDATTAGVRLHTPASVYSDSEKGKLTASGELYHPENLTAASSTFALGSILFVLNPETGKGTYVRVNDKTELKGILLSKSAASALGLKMTSADKVIVNNEN